MDVLQRQNRATDKPQIYQNEKLSNQKGRKPSFDSNEIKKIFSKKGCEMKTGGEELFLSEMEGRREISGNGSCVCSLFLLNPTLPFHLPGKSLKSQAIFCSPCTTAGKTRVFEANYIFWLVFKSHYLITIHSKSGKVCGVCFSATKKSAEKVRKSGHKIFATIVRKSIKSLKCTI